MSHGCRGAVDFDANNRVFIGIFSATVDMGTYEYGSFPFKIVEVNKTSGEEIQLKWTSRRGDTYAVWSCSLLDPGTWTSQAAVPSQGASSTWSDSDTSSSQKFYRMGIE
jgi:hypothetical protein